MLNKDSVIPFFRKISRIDDFYLKKEQILDLV